MGRKGPTRHMKRQQAPTFWTIHRKENVWSINTSPGPHNFGTSIPVTVLLRDMLRLRNNPQGSLNDRQAG